ncbi:hypothetical protein Ddye_024051 [Dipteronia dyeriana]|uniref:Protein FAR1-RELATED SEQUENCE n=1 Tax=Dipteronia dyeriana TaxID=168575 RepID=A0AAD9WTU3_9ROSI|nr:hypothetical protein Ddye_024051 [Dipteronia dyeriana]
MDNHGETISFGCVLLQDESSQYSYGLYSWFSPYLGSQYEEFEVEFDMLCHIEGVEDFEHQWNLLVAHFGLDSDKHIALLSSYRASQLFSYVRGYFLAQAMTIDFSQSSETFLKRILSGQTCLPVFFSRLVLLPTSET